MLDLAPTPPGRTAGPGGAAWDDFHLISPIFPSGVAWLLNILLELHICVYRSGDAEFWQQRVAPSGEATFAMQPRQATILRQWLPTLEQQTSFAFRESVRVRWTHEWPSREFLPEPARTVFFFRDGRDAVYSYAKRERPGVTFETFLREPFEVEQAFHPRFNPRLDPAATWALFCGLWPAVVGTGGLLLSFEEMKAEPRREVRRLLEFIGVRRDDDVIVQALERSTTERAQEVEARYRRQHPDLGLKVVNRRGMPGEWKEVYGVRELQVFKGLPDLVLTRLGYVPVGATEPETGGPAEALRKRVLDCFRSAREPDLNALEARLVALLGESGDVAGVTTAVVGEACASCGWLRDLYGGPEIGDLVARRTLVALAELTQRLGARPLVLLAAARALYSLDRGEQADSLVREVLVDPELTAGELQLAAAAQVDAWRPLVALQLFGGGRRCFVTRAVRDKLRHAAALAASRAQARVLASARRALDGIRAASRLLGARRKRASDPSRGERGQGRR